MKVGEHPKHKTEVCEFKKPVALVLTYNRTGLLTGTVNSFLNTTSCIPLHIFDDGSDSDTKHLELGILENLAKVHRLPHAGLAQSWRTAFELIYKMGVYDSVIMLEDDIVFAKGWLDVLRDMQAGIAGMGLLQGMTTCFRSHSVPQMPLVSLNGVRAYQSMAHGFQVNLMPMAVLGRLDIFDEAAEMMEFCKKKTGQCLDIYWVGLLSHRLHRVNFVSEQSWVAHIGFESMVGKQGFGNCRHPGFELVPELKTFEKGWQSKV